VYEYYFQVINDRISLLRQNLNDLKESSSNETKNTAGDKHETALAMLQIEQKNVGQQLADALDQKLMFGEINPSVLKKGISKGSLIKTNRGWLFLSVALGKAIIDGIAVIAISPRSPLGQKLIGLNVNDIAEINGVKYVIEDIF